jgi:thiosulfate dehydrogenase [quinone] large subunit
MTTTTTSREYARQSAKSQDGTVAVVHHHPSMSGLALRVLALLRIAFGLTFLWAFVDKLFGLGYGTPTEGAWVNGGSPTEGFLANAATGPFADFYHSIAGAAWADGLFMIGLLGLGVALTLGIGMRVAGLAGAALYMMMWSVVLPPENNPVIDDHILGAITMVLLAVTNAGDTWGMGKTWGETKLVRRYPVLR